MKQGHCYKLMIPVNVKRYMLPKIYSKEKQKHCSSEVLNPIL